MGGAFLVIDVGTSSVRVAALSDDGAVRASSSAPLAAPRGDDGAATLDPEGLWAALTGIARGITAGRRITAIGLAAQLGVVLLDRDRSPVVSPMTWGDRRGAALVDGLDGAVGDEVRTRSGRRISPELLAVKLAWLGVEHPELAGRVRWALSLKDHLLHRLTGRLVTDETHASYTLLYDVVHRRWSPELTAAFGVDPEILPPVRAATHALELAPEAATALGVEAGLPVAVGGPDGTVGALGAGGVRDGLTVDIAGSTDVIVHVTGQPVVDDAGAAVLNAHAVPGRWTLGGPTGLTGGGLARLLRGLGWEDVGAAHRQLGAAAAALPPGSDGLTVLTALGGGRFPHWRPELAGGVLGIAEHHSAAHLLRAAHEGAAFLVLDGLEAVERLGRPVGEVVVVGGVATGPQWLQVRADAWQRPVVPLAVPEATSVGAGMLAGVAGGRFRDLDEAASRLVRRSERVEPRTEVAGAMACARERWHRLLAAASAPDAAPSKTPTLDEAARGGR